MPAANVLRLDEYRDRRDSRREMARALHAGDSVRSLVLPHLSSLAEITASDRVAIVWVDEFTPRRPHPWLVLDLASDRPRRDFALDILERAWERGVPGSQETAVLGAQGRSSSFAIALGSDGTRGWFVVADTLSGRRLLDVDQRARAMFMAGECSAVVLHRDLDRVPGADPNARFTGWRYLADLEGHDPTGPRADQISRRYAVGRLVDGLLEDDLSVSADRRAEQVARARAEVATFTAVAEEEREVLEAVLSAFESGELLDIASAALGLGAHAEAVDHPQAALAAYEGSFRMAAALAEPSVAVNAARSLGRLHRRRAWWDDATVWYERAFEIARVCGLGELAARSLSGLGLVKRDVGNLPAARERFEEALGLAQTAAEPNALASVHNDLMGLEQMVGDYPAALRHGWRAANTYTSEAQRARGMAGLGGVLLEVGALDEAADAFAVVERTTSEVYYLLYASDALAHVGALRGDHAEYDRRTRRSDELGFYSGPAYAKAELLLYRGLSCTALGRFVEGRTHLEQSLALASDLAFNRVLFRVEDALAALDEAERAAVPASPEPWTGTPDEVRDGLRSLREELVGAEA